MGLAMSVAICGLYVLVDADEGYRMLCYELGHAHAPVALLTKHGCCVLLLPGACMHAYDPASVTLPLSVTSQTAWLAEMGVIINCLDVLA